MKGMKGQETDRARPFAARRGLAGGAKRRLRLFSDERGAAASDAELLRMRPRAQRGEAAAEESRLEPAGAIEGAGEAGRPGRKRSAGDQKRDRDERRAEGGRGVRGSGSEDLPDNERHPVSPHPEDAVREGTRGRGSHHGWEDRSPQQRKKARRILRAFFERIPGVEYQALLRHLLIMTNAPKPKAKRAKV